MLGISRTSSQAVFVYLWICICVFVYLTAQNIIFDVLGPLAFQKYSIKRVYKVFRAWWRTNEQQPGEPRASPLAEQWTELSFAILFNWKFSFKKIKFVKDCQICQKLSYNVKVIKNCHICPILSNLSKITKFGKNYKFVKYCQIC